MSPERAAEQILRAVERNRMRVVICREARVSDWLKRLTPAGSQHLLAAVMRLVGPIS